MNLAKNNSATLTNLWSQKLGGLKFSKKTSTVYCGIYKCPLKLRGFGENPILFLRDAPFPIDQAKEFCKRPTLQSKIVVCADEKTQEQLQFGWDLPRNTILISRDELSSLLTIEKPHDYFAKLVLDRFEWINLIPFSTSSPAFGNMFIGRGRELNELLFLEQDHALCGDGGIGKSSLLEQMVFKLRESQSPRFERIVRVDLIDCPPNLDAAANRIAMAIHADSRAHSVGLHDLLSFIRHCSSTLFNDGPIELIIDEMDKVLHVDSLQKDAEGFSYPLMRILRNARHSRPRELIRLTLSGRHQTEELLTRPDNPFAVAPFDGKPNSRFRLIKLEAFKPQTAWPLIRDPLKALGGIDRFPRQKLTRRVLECRGIPFQLQKLGLDLCVELMNAS